MQSKWHVRNGHARSNAIQTKPPAICRIARDGYNGFANRVLWPILHFRLDLAEFARRDLTGYMRVNDHFAAELEKIIEPDDLVWVHDYHLIPRAGQAKVRCSADVPLAFSTTL